MTPKEQAKEFTLQFYEVVKNKYPLINAMPLAKQCALISIDNEIVSLHWINLLCPFDNYMKQFLNSKIDELREVKQEIEKL